jgi:Thioredoxin-like
MLRSTLIMVLLAFICASHGYSVQTEAPASVADWITGSGDTLEFHINGVAMDESGNRIPDVQVRCEMETPFAITPLQVKTGANGEFRFSIPFKDPWLWAIRVSAETQDGSHIGYRSLEGRELRCVARDGLALTMKKLDGPDARTVEITVVDEDGPVPGASVKAVVQNGRDVLAVADERGIATLRMLHSEKLDQITAWQEDKRIGGYQVSRGPVRNPSLDRYTVELNRSRPLTVRLLDEQGRPVPEVKFRLSVSTGSPHFNFFGHNEYTTLTTNLAGEAIASWFPDWPDVNYFVDLKTDEWKLRDDVRGALGRKDMEYVLKKSRKAERKTVQGRIEFSGGTPAGFQVFLRSFQGETEHRSDVLTSHADQHGNFFADVLPGATYSFYIDDTEWVSETDHAVLFDTETGKGANPILKVVKGHELRVVVTQGPDKKPLTGQNVFLRSEHPMTWIENGEERRGRDGRGWSVTTDANGTATTYATAGQLTASAYAPEWQMEEKIEVAEGKTSEIRLHRPFGEAVRLSGELKSSSNAVLDNATVTVAALDGHSRAQPSVQTDESGRFSIDIMAAKVGVYVRTADGRHSATSIVEIPTKGTVEMALEPTIEYSGQLLGENDMPLANVDVLARVEMQDFALGGLAPGRLVGNIIETKTNDDGRYVLTGVPVGIRFVLEYLPPDNSSAPRRVGERFVSTGENRPLDVHRTVPLAAAPLPFAESTSSHMGDCRRYGIHSLVFVLSNDKSLEWSNEIVSNIEENRALLGYLPRLIKTDKLNEQEDKKEFFAKYNLQAPEADHVTVCALSGAGELVARLDLDCNNPESEKMANEFIATHEPPAGDARKNLDAALADAKQTGRVVWAQHSQTRCGPCLMLSRWIEEHRDVLEKQFVFVKVDDVREKNGIEVSKLVTGDRHFGIPFVAIINPEGEILIDAEGPLGNIGYPSDFEGAMHLRKMISSTGDQISDAELDSLVDSLLK